MGSAFVPWGHVAGAETRPTAHDMPAMQFPRYLTSLSYVHDWNVNQEGVNDRSDLSNVLA